MKRRIFIKGISQGSGLALACAGLVPESYKVQVAYPFYQIIEKLMNMGKQQTLVNYHIGFISELFCIKNLFELLD